MYIIRMYPVFGDRSFCIRAWRIYRAGLCYFWRSKYRQLSRSRDNNTREGECIYNYNNILYRLAVCTVDNKETTCPCSKHYFLKQMTTRDEIIIIITIIKIVIRRKKRNRSTSGVYDKPFSDRVWRRITLQGFTLLW